MIWEQIVDRKKRLAPQERSSIRAALRSGCTGFPSPLAGKGFMGPHPRALLATVSPGDGRSDGGDAILQKLQLAFSDGC